MPDKDNIPQEIKRQMIEAAKNYASHTNGGVTLNNPDKYKYFRDGSDFGYSLASPRIKELEDEVSMMKDEKVISDLAYKYVENELKEYEKQPDAVVEDLQEQVRKHVSLHDLFDWHEALTENEMTYLENLLLTFAPIFPPGSIGYNKSVKPFLEQRVKELEHKNFIITCDTLIKAETRVQELEKIITRLPQQPGDIKTAEEILNKNYNQNLGFLSITWEQVISAMEQFASQFKPVPDEAVEKKDTRDEMAQRMAERLLKAHIDSKENDID